jgi:nucleosome binding factor SPN SPT16 subunit
VETEQTAPRVRQSLAQFEAAFEQEQAAERRRRTQLRQRASNRSRARRIARTESAGRVRFGVLFLALTATVVVVVIAMFETLAWLMA